MSNTKQKHLVYWVLPGLFLIISMLIYFYNIFGLAFIIAPEFNRELGLIENVQLLTILSIIVMAFKGSNLTKGLQKYFYLIIVFFSIFIFLEEIDYGLHIIDYFSGSSNTAVNEISGGKQVRNIHNQGKLTHFIKLGVYVSFVLILVILPTVKKKII